MTMQTRYEEKPVSGFWYLLGGAAIGTIAGILLAPKAGSETREELSEWRHGARERARQLLDKIPGRVKAAAAGGAVKSGASEAYSEAKEKVRESFGS